MKSTREWFHLIGSTYNRQIVDSAIGDLYSYYRSFGFQDVHISKEEQRSGDGAQVTLIFHIQEGSRYRLQAVPDVHGSLDIPREQLIALSSFKPGDYLDWETLKQDMKAIADYIGKRGRAVQVDAIPVWLPDSPGELNVRYEVVGPIPLIGEIRVSGNKRISTEFILAHIPLQHGQTFRASDLRQAEKNLADLGLFVVDEGTGVWPTITVIDVFTEGEYKDLLITVKEKPSAKPKRTGSQE